MEKKLLIVQHADTEGPGFITDYFGSYGWSWDISNLSQGDRLPKDVDDYAAVISLGGPMNVYQDISFPFLIDEDRLITQVLVKEVPFLGICLGAQLLAKTCGGTITKARKKEFGWYSVFVNGEAKDDRLFRDLPRTIKVFQWHEDTFDVPPGGVLLARGQAVRNQAFRVGSNAYGVQFHLEATPDMITKWVESEKDLPEGQRIISKTKKFNDECQEISCSFFDNFKSLAESSFRIRRVLKLFLEDENEKKKKPFFWWDWKKGTPLPVTDG